MPDKASDSIKDTSHRIGLEIETAVAQDNLQDYRQAMNKVTELVQANPTQKDAITSEVMGTINRDDALKAVVDYATLHTDHESSSVIKKEELTDARSKASNAVEQTLLDVAAYSYDQLPPSFISLKISNASISGIEGRLHQEQAELLPKNQIRNFFQKNEQGISLFDRVKDGDDSIRDGAIAKLQSGDMTASQRSTLNAMDKHQSNKYLFFGDRGMTGDAVKQLVTENNMNFYDLVGRTRPENQPKRAQD